MSLGCFYPEAVVCSWCNGLICTSIVLNCCHFLNETQKCRLGHIMKWGDRRFGPTQIHLVLWRVFVWVPFLLAPGPIAALSCKFKLLFAILHTKINYLNRWGNSELVQTRICTHCRQHQDIKAEIPQQNVFILPQTRPPSSINRNLSNQWVMHTRLRGKASCVLTQRPTNDVEMFLCETKLHTSKWKKTSPLNCENVNLVSKCLLQ